MAGLQEKSHDSALFPSDFSKHLFWDVDVEALDVHEHFKYIIKNVLMYGVLEDWKAIVQLYGAPKIAETACAFPDLDKKTASFVSLVTETPLEKFLCFTTVQSTRKHWNF